MSKCVLLLSALLLTLGAQAEVHRWVDEQGRVHFGDSKSVAKVANSEDISQEVSRINLDSGSRTTAEQMQQTREVTAQVEGDLAAMERQKLEARRARYGATCKQLQQEIQLIESGEPVRFVNEDGSENIVREQDRGIKVAEWRETYRRLECDQILAAE